MASLDHFTLAALADTLLDRVVGGRVQDTVMLDGTSLGFEIYAQYQRHYLLISADKQQPRLHLAPAKLRRGADAPSQLALLVRRYLEGGLLTHISQPPWERVLHLEFTSPESDTPLTLIVEPMERRSNVLLVRDGIILDCARRVGPDENRVRVSLPNHPYVPPPPLIGRLHPAQADARALAVLLVPPDDDPKRKTAQVLASRVLGLSPLLAREVLHRAGAPVNQLIRDADPAPIVAALREVVTPLLARQWQPGIALDDGRPVAYSVTPLTHLPSWQPTEDIHAALVAYYGEATGPDAYRAAKEPVRAALDEARARVHTKLASLAASLQDTNAMDALRKGGELLLAYQYTLTPGQDVLRAQYDPDGPELEVRLDTTLTPLENAHAYFRRYDKAKRAHEGVPALVEAARQDLAALDQWAVDLDLAANWPEIDEVRAALVTAGYWSGPAGPRVPGGQKSGPLRVVTRDGFVLWVGRNSRQNDVVTFDKGSPADLWLHARGVPGAHVVVKFDGRAIPDGVVEQAAALAAHYSAKRADAAVIVDVTERRHVRKIKGAAPGQVTYRNETTRTVAPQPEGAFPRA